MGLEEVGEGIALPAHERKTGAFVLGIGCDYTQTSPVSSRPVFMFLRSFVLFCRRRHHVSFAPYASIHPLATNIFHLAVRRGPWL